MPKKTTVAAKVMEESMDPINIRSTKGTENKITEDTVLFRIKRIVTQLEDTKAEASKTIPSIIFKLDEVIENLRQLKKECYTCSECGHNVYEVKLKIKHNDVCKNCYAILKGENNG